MEYVCRSCELDGEGKSTTYNTLSPQLIAQLDDAMRASLDFVVLSKRVIVSRNTLNLVVASMEQGGNGFGKLEEVSARILGTELAHREEDRQFELIRQAD